MSWLEKIQKLPQAAKIRIIWLAAAAACIVLVLLWILTSPFQKHVGMDLKLFETIGRSFHDIRSSYNK